MRTTITSYILFLSVFIVACDRQSIDEPQTSATCEKNTHCQFANGVEIWLPNSVISPETPFSINLKLPPNAYNVSAKLEGVTMYMGYIPLQFTQKGSYWSAQTMVGVCSEPVMTWKMTVVFTDAQNRQQSVFYYFDSRHAV
ncbi:MULTISPECIES: hypothetical protein [Pseudoalteromonas]|uniref:Lipoprotein n=1 Tax=Pseudoalteromonas lipolytica TaxID=570156 RepID=A0ABY1GQS8_9GAMM|nr:MULTISPECIES: hypothetical protein [Pseudoalteromonas]SFT85814.1 hypothetical protein SAMN04487854_11285 [Pseudoalteromonas lipolytica]